MSTAKMKKPTKAQLLTHAVGLVEEGDDCTGICLECGNEQDGVEPDAEGYRCECCGKRKVAGAEQIVLMYGG